MVAIAQRSAALCLIVGLAGCGSTSTKTVTVNSASCLQELKSTLKAVDLLSADLRASTQYVPLIAQAAKAGEAKSVSQFQAIEVREKQITDQAGRYAKALSQLETSIDHAPGSCS
jgi:hypothetical protein